MCSVMARLSTPTATLQVRRSRAAQLLAFRRVDTLPYPLSAALADEAGAGGLARRDRCDDTMR
jgi:hypothetical protein